MSQNESPFVELGQKINSKKAVVGIIGLGYVGLPLGLRFAEEGFSAIGFDTDPKKVDSLNKGLSYIRHIEPEKIQKLIQSKAFRATSDYSLLKKTDCVLICVPTPLNHKKNPDLSFIEATADEIADNMTRGQLISLESTTYPGTTRDIVLPKLLKSDLQLGRDYFVVYSPEREDPGNKKYSTQNIPKVVGGATPDCTELGRALYGQIVDEVVVVSSLEAAEFTKILENTFRSVNIALVNELKILAHKMGVDIHEIIEAAATKPFGYMPFYPGPGLGGHCVPIDPFYLSWKAREYNFNTHFIELSGEINTSMPSYVIERLIVGLNLQKKCLKGSKVLVLGVAYKKDIDNISESPALEIIKLLKSYGADVFYNDPFIPRISNLRKFEMDMISQELTPGFLRKTDAVVITTDHSVYDYNEIVRYSRLIIDTRNAVKITDSNKNKVIKA
jgi:UDP-N-acetyl-D-glucosamine dehydrogenase